MIFKQIVAMDKDFAIGKDNGLLWHYPEDLRFFKDTTKNRVLIMGRKTFDSILKPKGCPLPQRFHIVISRKTPTQSYDRTIFVTSVEAAYRKAQEVIETEDYPEEIFIVGGAEIYRQTFDETATVYLTRIQKSHPGADTFFPYAELESKFKRANSKPSTEHAELTYEIWIPN